MASPISDFLRSRKIARALWTLSAKPRNHHCRDGTLKWDPCGGHSLTGGAWRRRAFLNFSVVDSAVVAALPVPVIATVQKG
jgi:hypothetical protein